jgi:hypothetical protein
MLRFPLMFVVLFAVLGQSQQSCLKVSKSDRAVIPGSAPAESVRGPKNQGVSVGQPLKQRVSLSIRIDLTASRDIQSYDATTARMSEWLEQHAVDLADVEVSVFGDERVTYGIPARRFVFPELPDCGEVQYDPSKPFKKDQETADTKHQDECEANLRTYYEVVKKVGDELGEHLKNPYPDWKEPHCTSFTALIRRIEGTSEKPTVILTDGVNDCRVAPSPYKRTHLIIVLQLPDVENHDYGAAETFLKTVFPTASIRPAGEVEAGLNELLKPANEPSLNRGVGANSITSQNLRP